MSLKHTPLTAIPIAAFLLAGSALYASCVVADQVIEEGTGAQDEILIEDEAPAQENAVTGAEDELVIEEAPAAEDGISIEEEAQGAEGELVIDGGDDTALPSMAGEAESSLRFTLDDVRLEYGHQVRDGSVAERELYGKFAASLNWRPQPQWELQLSGRLDGYDQDGQREWSELRADYGDSYVRYRGDRVRLTVGAQTVIWGRMDEVPLSDRVSTADLTPLVLDKLEDRRRANPMVRAEMNVGEGKLDVVWLADFRPAELPDKDSIWYPSTG